jgi:hypothetical protein
MKVFNGQLFQKAATIKMRSERMIEHDYITGGILQDYCLGLLSDEDERKVEAMCHAYPQVARELQLLRLALEKYGGSDKVRRRDELRRDVLEAVKKLWEEESS